MIKESRPISIAEVINLAGDNDQIKKFVKNFKILSYNKAKELENDIKNLDLIKLKDEHIVKIIDFVPTNSEELNKVILEVSLDQEEINKILEVTKKYK